MSLKSSIPITKQNHDLPPKKLSFTHIFFDLAYTLNVNKPDKITIQLGSGVVMSTNGFRYSRDCCSEEFSELQLGDSRLSERFVSTAERLFASPESSVNQACVSWSESKAAYRLFDNKKLTPDKIIIAHQSFLTYGVHHRASKTYW